jgi:TPR repeat protein
MRPPAGRSPNTSPLVAYVAAVLTVSLSLLQGCATASSDVALCAEYDFRACVRQSQAEGSYPVDPELVRGRFAEAAERCAAGDDDACLGWAVFNDGVLPAEPAPERVLEALEAACEAGESEACGHLGYVLMVEREPIPVDRERALPHLRRACDEVGGWACYHVAVLLHQSGEVEEAAAVRDQQREACDAGTGTGSPCLATFAILGTDVAAGVASRIDYARGACLEHSTDACLSWYFNREGPLEPGPERDQVVAELEAECATGDADHCRVRIVIDSRESGDSAADERALAQLLALCRAGTTNACWDAPYLIDGAIAATSSKRSFLYLTELCFTFGVTSACGTYAEALFEHLSTAGHAVRAASALCDEGKLGVCATLGEWLLRVPVLRDTAARSPEEILGRACDGGSGRACAVLSDRYDGVYGHPIDIERSTYLLWQACELSDRDACDEREELALLTSGFPAEPARRAVQLRRACDEGDVQACLGAGLLFADADPGYPDAERAGPPLERACAAGVGYACLRLGELYSQGLLPADGEHHTRHYYQLGCDAGNSEACNFLGVMSEERLGGADYDIGETEGAYRSACEGGSRIGCANLGWLLWWNSGEVTPSAEIEDLAVRACPDGEPFACALLGYVYSVGTERHPLDAERGLALYERACDGGNHRGCVFAGEIYELRDEAEAAFDRYHRGCVAGSGLGCYYQALCYRIGYGVAKSHAWAGASLQQSCAMGNAEGCEQLGWAHFDGMGVSYDWDLAFRFWQRACDLGRASACQLLDEWDQLSRPVAPAKPAR